MLSGDVSLLTNINTTTNAPSYAFPSVTLPANVVCFLWVGTRLASGGGIPSIPSITGGGVTWDQVNTITRANAAGDFRLTLFRTMTGSNVTQVFTADFTAETQEVCCAGIVKFTNTDISGTRGAGSTVQSVTLSASSAAPSITLAAFGNANNGTFGVFVHSAASTTPGSGFSQVLEGSAGSSPTARHLAEWTGANDTTVDAVMASAQAVVGIAVEIKATTAATPVINLFVPVEGYQGASVVISGVGFTGVTGATGVKFNSVNATSYVVNSDIQITAVVPNMVASGLIAVTNASGSTNSANTFYFTEIESTTLKTSGQSVTISWTYAAGDEPLIDEFVLQRSAASTGPFLDDITEIATTARSVTFMAPPVAVQTTYYYRVVGRNSSLGQITPVTSIFPIQVSPLTPGVRGSGGVGFGAGISMGVHV